jgi:hypothetical protein
MRGFLDEGCDGPQTLMDTALDIQIAPEVIGAPSARSLQASLGKLPCRLGAGDPQRLEAKTISGDLSAAVCGDRVSGFEPYLSRQG